MASMSSATHLPCKILQKSYQHPKLAPKAAFSTLDRVNLSALSTKLNRNLTVRAVPSDDEWGTEKEPSYSAVATEEPPKEPTEMDLLKKQLVDSFYGTNRGLSASSETRAEIVELITQLESKNPTPAPTEALSLLNGKWILA